MVHLIDARRPVGHAATRYGIEYQTPVICKQDIVTWQGGDALVVTSRTSAVTCPNCLDIIHGAQVGSKEWLFEKGRHY